MDGLLNSFPDVLHSTWVFIVLCCGILITLLIRLLRGPRRVYAAVSLSLFVIGVAALQLSKEPMDAWAHAGGITICLWLFVASLVVCGDIRDIWSKLRRNP